MARREKELATQSIETENHAVMDPCPLCSYKDEGCPIEDKIKPMQCEKLIFGTDTTNEEIAEYFLNINAYKTMKDTGEIYVYHDGIYAPNGDIEIKELIEKHYLNASIHVVNEITAHIQRKTYTNRTAFDSNPYLMTCENGIIDLRTPDMLNDFSPNYLSLIKIPIEYNPSATCPAIEKFFSEIVNQEDIQTLFEIVGFCLIKRYFIHKAIMQVGDTHSGKSTFQKLLCKLIGERNITHQPLQTLIKERFASSQLYGKLINCFADLPNNALKYTGFFKALTGEDTISAERKFKDPFEFENIAKLIFSCNEMPKTSDKSDAFFIRWIIINFPNRFDDKNPRTDKMLIDKLTTPQELSGLLNKGLEAAKTLFKNQHFTNNLNVEEIRLYYEKLSNPIYAFTEENCIKQTDGEIPKKEFYMKLMTYCMERKLTLATSNFTTQEMKRLGFSESQKHDGSRIWEGLRWKTPDERDVNLDDF